jgi:hypothetical protein
MLAIWASAIPAGSIAAAAAATPPLMTSRRPALKRVVLLVIDVFSALLTIKSFRGLCLI